MPGLDKTFNFALWDNGRMGFRGSGKTNEKNDQARFCQEMGESEGEVSFQQEYIWKIGIMLMSDIVEEKKKKK